MPTEHPNILLAKQPIYALDQSLFGFELLYRDANNQNAWDVGEDLATSQVLVNYATSIGEELDTCDAPIFINVSEDFLLSEAFLPINPCNVIIEILERVEVTETFVNTVKNWHLLGYRFALDDYDHSPRWQPLLPYCDFVKVDILESDLDQVRESIQPLLAQKITLVAERIEDMETFEKCKEMGFGLFQGYYLARPKELLGNSIRPSSAITTEIIKRSNQANVPMAEIAELVSQDPKLTVQLLKLINSSLFTLPREINNLKEAITFLGIDLLKKWAMMIAFVSDATAHIESCRIILIRAKCCELFLKDQTNDDELAASGFLAGLMSGVDVLLELKPEIFVREVNLGKDIMDAILGEPGLLGSTILQVKSVEHFITQDPLKVGELNTDMLSSYSQAQRWAGEIIAALQEHSV